MMVVAESVKAQEEVPTRIRRMQAQGFQFEITGNSVTYILPREGRLALALYDYSGQLLGSAHSEVQKSGRYTMPLPNVGAHPGRVLLMVDFRSDADFARVLRNH
jgi:hypothetical protein